MRFISPVLKHAVYPALHHAGWLDHITPPGGYAVVNYHGVGPSESSEQLAFLDGNLVRPEVFRRQLKFLKTHYKVIHPEEFRAWVEKGKPLAPRAVLVTCDDGLVNNLTEMLPILESEGVVCLFFVTGASCGDNPGMLWYEELYHLMRIKPLSGLESQLPKEEGGESAAAEDFQGHWWRTVRRASQLPGKERTDWMGRVRSDCGLTLDFYSEGGRERRWRLLNVTELKRLARAGMAVGAHTRSHPVLSLCSEEEAWREIQQSKIDLERALGQEAWAFAYPFGNSATMGKREVRLAREAGFACAFLNVEYWEGEALHEFALPRIHVCGDTTIPELAAHLSGIHTRFQRAVRG